MGELTEIAVDKIIPYSQNNRKHSETQVDRIAESIVRFGFNQPIVVDEDNIILVGHGRLLAAKKLGLESVPILRREGLTETQKRAYRILDNKIQNDSEWDFSALSSEIELLREDEFDLDFWGLDDLTKPINIEDDSQEIDIDTLDQEMTIKAKYDYETYHFVVQQLRKVDEDIAKAIYELSKDV